MYMIRNAAGDVVDIGIHDTDFISMANDPAVFTEMARVGGLFNSPSGMPRLFNYSNQAKAGALDAPTFMRELYERRFDVKAPF